MSSGWIKLHRSLTDWEWYDDINVSRLFIHLLLTVNHKDKNWRGITIKKGSRLTSLDKLSVETKLSVSKIRTAIKKLILTNEIASKSHSQHTVFTVINYNQYQRVDKPIDKPVTNESQTDDKRIATNKNVKNEKNERKETISRRFSPPTDLEVISYFKSKNSTAIEAEKFWNFYDSKNWFVGKSKMKKWESAASGWIARNQEKPNGFKRATAENFSECDYGETQQPPTMSDEEWKSLGGTVHEKRI